MAELQTPAAPEELDGVAAGTLDPGADTTGGGLSSDLTISTELEEAEDDEDGLEEEDDDPAPSPPGLPLTPVPASPLTPSPTGATEIPWQGVGHTPSSGSSPAAPLSEALFSPAPPLQPPPPPPPPP
eukprot:Hpha_TRINITY_DN18392_c0_g1::TRINITY_DN18392_c0_g1_i1::g.158276::m.158276